MAEYIDYIMIVVITVAAILTWLGLCSRGVIPEPYASWSWKVVAAIATLGGSVLVGRLMADRKGKTDPEPDPTPKIVVEHGPTDKEVEDLETNIEEVGERADETDEKLDEIDAREDHERATGDDSDAGGAFAERLRNVQAGSGQGEDLP